MKKNTTKLEELEHKRNKIKKAVKVLTEALKKDKDFYYGYQSNIAMAFNAEFEKMAKENNIKEIPFGIDIHKVANQAARNFLNMWIK